MWLFQFFLGDQARSALSSRTIYKSYKWKRHDGKLSTYPQVVQSLLRRYETDDIVAAAESELIRCTQDRMTEEAFADSLWNKALR